ncbi:MAG: amidohydrolase [Lautropia sp.]
MTGVDTHAHVFPSDAPLTPGRHRIPDVETTAQAYVALLRAHGLSHGVVTAPSFYGFDNSAILDALRAFPDNLRGTVSLAPETGPAELGRLHDAGVRGLRLNYSGAGGAPDLGGKPWAALLGALRELGWHLEIYLECEHMPRALPALRAANVRIVLDHFAGPGPQGPISSGFDAVLDALQEGRTWIKLSALNRARGADPRRLAEALLAAAGPERLLWGSDWPWLGKNGPTDYGLCLAQLEAWVPDAAQRRIILAETPRALFSI